MATLELIADEQAELISGGWGPLIDLSGFTAVGVNNGQINAGSYNDYSNGTFSGATITRTFSFGHRGR